MTPDTARLCAKLLAVAGLVMSLSACEGGSGCGEPPKQQGPQTSVSGASGHASGPSGGDVSLNSENAINTLQNRGAAPDQQPPQAKPEPARPIFAEVNKAFYEPKVLKALGGVLVVSYTPGCKGWSDLKPALKGLSEDLAGKVAVYRLDVSDSGQAAVLPSGMTRKPVPGFAYYESGQALGKRQGLPFDRHVGKQGEPLEDSPQYQSRLRRWLDDAVAARNFDLPEPKFHY